MSDGPKGKTGKPKTAERDATKLQQILERRKKRGSAEQADYGSVDPLLLLSVVASVTKAGGAIQFGYTVDGGAYRIRLLIGGEVQDEYVRPTEDIDSYLRALCLDFDGSC